MSKPTGTKVERSARLRWVPLAKVRVNPLAQRELKQPRVDELVADFDLEQFGSPTVNSRDGYFNVLDGQHRIAALKEWFGEGHWEDQQIQCWSYDDLTDDEEAEVFLRLNNTLAVTAMAKFKVGVQAGRGREVSVHRIVQTQGLRVDLGKSDGVVSAVGTLMRIYDRSGGEVLARTLRVARDAYGQAGLDAAVLDGIGLLCHRFNGEIDEGFLTKRLATTLGGLNGLLGKAEKLKQRTRNPRAHCIAAAAVDINNAGRGGRKLPSWWRDAA